MKPKRASLAHDAIRRSREGLAVRQEAREADLEIVRELAAADAEDLARRHRRQLGISEPDEDAY